MKLFKKLTAGVFFVLANLPIIAQAERDTLVTPEHDSTDYGYIFNVNTEANTDDIDLGDGICADSAGNCSMKGALDEARSLYSIESTEPILIRIMVDTIEWDETVVAASAVSSYGWEFYRQTITIRGYDALTKSGKSRWILPDKMEVFNLPDSTLWLDNFEMLVIGNEDSSFTDLSLITTRSGELTTSLKITNFEATRESTNGFFRFFYFRGSYVLEEVTGFLEVENSSFYGFGAQVNDSGEILIPEDERSESRGGTFWLNNAHVSFLASRINSSASGGSGGAMLIVGNNSRLVIDQSIFENNFADSTGGALVFDCESCDLSIRQSQFLSNQASSNGGAVSLFVGSLLIEDSFFEGNKSGRNGGAISLHNINRLNVKNSRFLKNTADSGGVFSFGPVISVDELNIENSIFNLNTANRDAAVFLSRNYGNAKIINSQFLNNTTNRGSIIRFEGINSLLVENSRFVRNRVIVGEYDGVSRRNSHFGISRVSGEVRIKNSSFIRNSSLTGALYTYEAEKVVIEKTDFLNNESYTEGPTGGVGAAVYSLASGALEIKDSRILNNSAQKSAAVYFAETPCWAEVPFFAYRCYENLVRITNTEIAHNKAYGTADSNVAGIYSGGAVNLQIDGSYVHHNIGGDSLKNGGLYYTGPKLEVLDSTFAYNRGDEVGGIYANIYPSIFTIVPTPVYDSRGRLIDTSSLIQNSTISQNSGIGVKISADHANTNVNLNYSTITLNQKSGLTEASGLVVESTDKANFFNEGMLIYGNQCGSDTQCDCASIGSDRFYTAGNNLISNNDSHCSFDTLAGLTAIDQRIDPAIYAIEDVINTDLELNGASLTPNHFFVEDSPALNTEGLVTERDVCADLGVDQRGFARDRHCERGAIEAIHGSIPPSAVIVDR